MPTPPALSHPSMRRPTRPPADSHPLASFTVPPRVPLSNPTEEPAPANPESSTGPGIVDLPSMEVGIPPAAAGAEEQQEGQEQEGQQAPEGSASALNYLVDAVDYLDWDLHLPFTDPRASSSHVNSAGLGDSMGAVLEAQRLMSREEASLGEEGQGREGMLGEHAALLMEFGQGGPSTSAGLRGGKRSYEEEEEVDEGGAAGAYAVPDGGKGGGKRRALGGGRKVGGGGAGGRKGKKKAGNQDNMDPSLPNGSPAPSGSGGGKSTNLTEAQRKLNHTLSEKRRRNALKIGYAELGCIEHISVNEWWPSGEMLVDAEGGIKDVPGVNIEGRLPPLLARPKKRTKKEMKAREEARKRGEEVPEDDEEDGGEGKPLAKQPPNRVAKGWSKVAVLKKGAALAKWMREGNEWLEEEVRRLEDLLGEERIDVDEMRRRMEVDQQNGVRGDEEGGEGGEGGMEAGLDPALREEERREDGMMGEVGEFERDILGVAADQLEEMFRGQ